MKTPTGVGFQPRVPITYSERQAVMDAAAVAKGSVPGVEIRTRGTPTDIGRWMMRESHKWRELLSTRPFGFPEHLRVSLPNNRIIVANGLRMISVFDHNGLRDEARTLLAAEQLGTYLIGACTMQMNIVDRRFAMLQGPDIDGETTVMAVTDPACLAAAWAYWHRVMDSAYPLSDQPMTDGPPLSTRQRQILALLAAETQDDAIASTLGVSVRTVRSDIAEVLRILGVRSRFAAGIRFQEMTERHS